MSPPPQPHLARRAATLERHRRRRQQAPYRPWRRLTRDQQAVAERLTSGRVDLVTVSGWGIVGPWLACLDEGRFFARLAVEGAGFTRIMLPIARVVLTYQVKRLLGIGSIKLVPTRLFRDVAWLKLIGDTTTQLAAGFGQRGNLAAGPMHKNPLADGIERLSAAELEALFNQTADQLTTRGFFRTSQGHCARDASDLETTCRSTGAGMTAITERKVTKKEEVVEIVRSLYGVKLLIVQEVRLRLAVAAKGVPITEHESRYTPPPVRQAIANLGPGVLRVLLMDRGFLDGEALWTLTHEVQVDFVVPAKDTMHVTADARSLSRRAQDTAPVCRHGRPGHEQRRTDGTSRWAGQVTVVGVAEVGSADQYGDAEHAKRANRKECVATLINAVVVTGWAGREYAVGEDPVFLTSLSVGRPLAVLDQYDLRSLIENTAFRELEQGWCLTRHPKQTAAAVRGHGLLTVLTFTLANAFQTARGQALARQGIRRQRAVEEWGEVIVFAGDHYALFDSDEVRLLLGAEPATCLRVDPAEVRRRYGRSPIPALPAAA